MNVTQQLMALAKTKHPALSQNGLGEFLGVGKATMSNWVNATREMDDANEIARIALLLEENPGDWLERFAIEAKASPAVRAYWRRVRAVAAAAVLASVALSAPAPSYAATGAHGQSAHNLYIMLIIDGL